MDLAAFSPQKLHVLQQCSPRVSARKRSLFPSNSPQSNDLGLISELYSDDSDGVYSPPPTSPTLSSTPDSVSGTHTKHDGILKVKNCLVFDNCSPKRSSRKSNCKLSFDKENIEFMTMSVRKSPKRLSRKQVLEKKNFDDHFTAVSSESSESEEKLQFDISSGNLSTPKNGTQNQTVAKPIIKPNCFYGKMAPLLATNQTNRIQGMKCVFRPEQRSKAKAKLLFEDKPTSKKRERSKSRDALREAKRRKAIYTGVHHAIPKHQSPPPVQHSKKETVREKARKITDLTRTPFGLKKKKLEGWEHTLRFTKPLRYEDSPIINGKKKFFKTSVQYPASSPGSVSSTPLSVVKKRKLFDSSKTYLETSPSPKKLKLDAADISELIEDNNTDKSQEGPEVEDILLRLEEDDDEEKRREAERQMLMNILEDSPVKTNVIDSLSNCTASLDLNDKFTGAGCSRFTWEEEHSSQSSKNSSPHIFSLNKQAFGTPKSNSSSPWGRNKWVGVGEDQLQIDAGQKKFGARECPDCGMIYQAGEAEDEMRHVAFHKNMSTLKHAGWKNERLVYSNGTDYIILITGDDPKTWQNKAFDVMALMDRLLGITPADTYVVNNQKVFLYISNKHVVGCVVAKPLAKAYKMIPSESDVNFCSDESYPVRCGISRIWTLHSHRRRGVASAMLDTVRRNFMYGNILSREDIAFSIPTPDGKSFAAKYMETPNFLVYSGY